MTYHNKIITVQQSYETQKEAEYVKEKLDIHVLQNIFYVLGKTTFGKFYGLFLPTKLNFLCSFHSRRESGEGLSRGLCPALPTALRGNCHADHLAGRLWRSCLLSSPLIHSGSLTEGAALVGAGITLANLLLVWPDSGCLSLFSAWLDRTAAMSL